MSTDERLDLLDGLIYADAFDCAVTLEELWRYARRPIGLQELRVRLREDAALAAVVTERRGLLCLGDRPELTLERVDRIERARRLQRRARWVARWLRHVPFVRGLALTGSLAADDARDGADSDLLVVVAPGRLATVFCLLGPASRLLGRELFCPNYYLSQDHLAMAPDGGIYLARELVQAQPLAGGVALRAANPWLAGVLPNACDESCAVAMEGGGRLQRLVERPLRRGLGERIERRAAAVARARLATHHRDQGGAVPEAAARDFATGVSLRFHGKGARDAALRRYRRRRPEVAAMLEAAAQAQPAARNRS